MARLNIDEELHKDRRYVQLILKLGCDLKAMGAYVYNLALAQEYHSVHNPCGLMSLADFRSKGRAVEEMLASGAARMEGNFVYIMKAESQFGWLTSDKVNGSIGGKKRVENAKKREVEAALAAQHKVESRGVEPGLSQPIAGVKATQPSSSSSNSFSKNKAEEGKSATASIDPMQKIADQSKRNENVHPVQAHADRFNKSKDPDAPLKKYLLEKSVLVRQAVIAARGAEHPRTVISEILKNEERLVNAVCAARLVLEKIPQTNPHPNLDVRDIVFAHWNLPARGSQAQGAILNNSEGPREKPSEKTDVRQVIGSEDKAKLEAILGFRIPAKGEHSEADREKDEFPD